MKSNRAVAFELQQLLIEAGLDVTLTPYQNCEVGKKTNSYDLRVEVEGNVDAFLDRVIISGDDPTKVVLTWTFGRDWPIALERDKLTEVLKCEPIPTAIRRAVSRKARAES